MKSYSKVAGSKKELHVIFKDFAKSLGNFDHDFFLKDCFGKPKLLVAANMLIYLNTSTNRCIRNSRPLGGFGSYFFASIKYFWSKN